MAAGAPSTPNPKKEEWLVPNHAVRSRVKAGMADATTLDHGLSGLTREGELFERLPGGRHSADRS